MLHKEFCDCKDCRDYEEVVNFSIVHPVLYLLQGVVFRLMKIFCYASALAICFEILTGVIFVSTVDFMLEKNGITCTKND